MQLSMKAPADIVNVMKIPCERRTFYYSAQVIGLFSQQLCVVNFPSNVGG